MQRYGKEISPTCRKAKGGSNYKDLEIQSRPCSSHTYFNFAADLVIFSRNACFAIMIFYTLYHFSSSMTNEFCELDLQEQCVKYDKSTNCKML